MADEPINPQKIIDDATNALGQTPPSDIPTPPPTETSLPKPESFVIPPKDQKTEPPPQVVKPPKKKGGKGMMIGILLFFILTLPVAIYYGSQKYQQITEGRSRAGLEYRYKCVNKGTCSGTEVTPFASSDCVSCRTSSTQVCCQTKQYVTPYATRTPTPRSPTATPTLPPPSQRCNQRTYAGGCASLRCSELYNNNSSLCNQDSCCYWGQNTPPPPPPSQRCNQKSSAGTCATVKCATEFINNSSLCNQNSCCYWGQTMPTDIPTKAPTRAPTSGGGGGGTTPTTRTKDGTWHNCDYINNRTSTGSQGGVGPEGSMCKNIIGNADFDNCGGKDCGQFTFKCGVYCLAASCGASACYDDAPAATNTPVPTDTPVSEATNTPVPTNTSVATPTERIVYIQPTERVVYVQQPAGVRVIAEAPIATETQRPTPKVPVSGGFFDIKAIGITFISIVFLTLGLIL